MSISVFQPISAKTSNPVAGFNGRSGQSLRSRSATKQTPSSFVDIQYNPYPNASESMPVNPVSDLIPDEVYSLLRSNDMINEKAVRDYIIRRAFRKLREEQNVKTAEAIGMIKELYPYLQLDTIRKIIYRISPVSRKMMI